MSLANGPVKFLADSTALMFHLLQNCATGLSLLIFGDFYQTIVNSMVTIWHPGGINMKTVM